MRLLATFFAQRMTAADMDRCATAKIGKREVDASIAAKSSAEQREQRLVLINGQQLTVTQRPTLRRENETHDSDFREKWFCHVFLLHRVNRNYFHTRRESRPSGGNAAKLGKI